MRCQPAARRRASAAGRRQVLRGRHHRRQGAADPTIRPLACCAADGMPQLDTARRCGGVAGGAPRQLLGCCDGLLARRGRLQHTRASPDGALVRPACGCVARARGHDCIAAPAAARELTALHRPLTRARSSLLIAHRLLWPQEPLQTATSSRSERQPMLIGVQPAATWVPRGELRGAGGPASALERLAPPE